MTAPHDSLDAGNLSGETSMSLLERWPGYDEQSWQERFNELDRRYSLLRTDYVTALMVHAKVATNAARVRNTVYEGVMFEGVREQFKDE